MNTKLEILKKYMESNTKETINLINSIIENNIEEVQNINYIEENKIFEGINIITDKKALVITICNKSDVNDLAYKYWAYFFQKNVKEKSINLLDKIDMEAYNYEQHHDILEINNKENNIQIKIHYVYKDELTKQELINEDNLLVLIENS